MPDSNIAASIGFFAKSEADAAPRPEISLVERSCAGDRDAFGELYKMFASLVHGILLSRVPYGEADDVAQEVFMCAYKSLHGLRDRSAVGPWLAAIARNRAAEFHRHSRKTEELSEDISHKGHTAEAYEILAAIRSLPASYSETLALRLIEGMTGREIAERTGLTHESVRVNLSRGMKILRQNLGIVE